MVTRWFAKACLGKPFWTGGLFQSKLRASKNGDGMWEVSRDMVPVRRFGGFVPENSTLSTFSNVTKKLSSSFAHNQTMKMNVM